MTHKNIKARSLAWSRLSLPVPDIVTCVSTEKVLRLGSTSFPEQENGLLSLLEGYQHEDFWFFFQK